MAHPKGNIPPAIAEQLVAAQQNLGRARSERDKLIVKALEAGGSLTVVAELLGLSVSGVRKIAHAHGWTAQKFHDDARRRSKQIADTFDEDPMVQVTDPEHPSRKPGYEPPGR